MKARGEEIFAKGLGLFDKALEGKDYLLGEFSFADSALFYVSFWWAGAARRSRCRRTSPPTTPG